MSHSSESRNVSPRTPTGRSGAGRTDDYYAPEIANHDDSNHSPRSNGRRPGGYGGFGDSDAPEPPQPPKNLAGNDFMQRMNNIASNPFDNARRPSTARNNFPQRKDSLDRWDPPPDEGFAPPQRTNGYGGFGGSGERTPVRADTFPRPAPPSDYPARRPSMPGSQQDRPRLGSGYDDGRPRTGQDASRRPPPRPVNDMQSQKDNGSNDFTSDFGIGNPYHSSSGSGTSSAQTHTSHESFSSAITTQTSPERTPPQRYVPNNRDYGRAAGNLPQPRREDFRPKDLRIDPAVQAPFRNPPPGMVESPYTVSPQEERYDPAIQHGLRDRGPSPTYGSLPRDNSFGAPRNGLRAAPPMRQGSRDPFGPPSRGDCKACKTPITGKSISSADGRLTGKYHKACFVCTTCTAPFASAEFYVHNDKPYCEQHYHKLNGSLCGSCGRGIEGQYLEDETMVKYHPGCFRCLDCGCSLSEGYFEVEGKSYCERDAWRRVQQFNTRAPNVDPDSYPPPPPMPADNSTRRPSNGMGRSPSGPRPGAAVGMHRGPYGVAPNGRQGGQAPKMNKRMTRIGMM